VLNDFGPFRHTRDLGQVCGIARIFAFVLRLLQYWEELCAVDNVRQFVRLSSLF